MTRPTTPERRSVRSLLLGLLALLVAAPALAHGDAMWIQEGGYTDKDGIGCCGPHDCHREKAVGFRESPEGIWVATGAGDEVLMKRELVGRGLYPSIDDDWWICIRGGEVKCVFKPTTGG
jgi:hypothetical protein